MHIEEVKLTKENLIKIKEIDNTFYTKENISLDWYLERYTEKHSAILLLDKDEIVGYIISVPIKKELYDTIMNGVIINDLQINPQMFIDESEYYYIVSCVILEKYRFKSYASKMLEKILNKEKKYCALTITTSGYHLVEKYMNFKVNVYKDINVFTRDNIKKKENV